MYIIGINLSAEGSLTCMRKRGYSSLRTCRRILIALKWAKYYTLKLAKTS